MFIFGSVELLLVVYSESTLSMDPTAVQNNVAVSEEDEKAAEELKNKANDYFKGAPFCESVSWSIGRRCKILQG